MMMEKLKEKEQFAKKIHTFFSKADLNGDGYISAHEFIAVLKEPMVLTWLQLLELEVYEVTALFNILDDNADGTVSYDEFLAGAMRLKGNARAVDLISIMHEQRKVLNSVGQLSDTLDSIMGPLGDKKLKKFNTASMSKHNLVSSLP